MFLPVAIGQIYMEDIILPADSFFVNDLQALAVF